MQNLSRPLQLLLYIILLPSLTVAQQVSKATDVNNPILRTAIIDSLNARAIGKSIGIRPPVSQMNGLHGLNEAAQSQFYQHVSQVHGAKELQRLQKGYALLKDTGRITNYLNAKMRGFYALKNDLNARSVMQKGAWDNHVKEISASAFTDNAPGATAPAGFLVNLEDNIVVGNIPVNVHFTNLSGFSTPDRNFLDQQLKQFSFDKDAYMQRMNAYVEKSYNLNKYFLGDIDVTSALKSFTSQRIASIQSDMEQMVDAQKAAAFKNLVSAEQLVYLDSSQITHLLLDNKVLQLNAEELSGKIPDTTLMATDAHGRTILAARHYLESVRSLKTNINEGLAAKETFTAQHKITGSLNGRLQDVETQKRNIKNLLPLNFLQKILLQAKSLDIGNIAASGSKGGVQDLFMSGAQGSFLNNNKFLMLGAGTKSSGGDIKDLNFTSSLDPGAYSMQFVQMGAGDINNEHSHVAMVNANTKNQALRQFNTQSLARNIFVGAFSEQIDLGEYGNVKFELSKSNTQFNNSATGNSYALSSKTAAFTLLNDFWETLSVGLDYSGEVRVANMTQRAYVSYSGLGYSNPASASASRGTIRYGGNLKRSWNKRKITVGLRMDMRDMNTSPLTNSKYRNRQYSIDTRIRIKKNFSLTGQIEQSMMKRISEKLTETGYLNRQIKVGSQLSGKLFSLSQNNNFSFSLQQMEMAPLKSMLVNFNLNHSILVNTHILTVSLFYNKDLKDQALYGNLLTAETGWSYQLGKMLSCSSGITYLDNKDVVRQLGIRQTVSTVLLSRLNVNLYADARKQLLNTARNYLFGNFSTQLSLNYQLNK